MVSSRGKFAALVYIDIYICVIVEPMGAFCGNALVEEGEECDPGPQSRGIDGDVCCNEKCQLKSNFQCR